MKKVLLALLVGSTCLSASNIIINPGFEDPSISPATFLVFGTGSAAINGWTVTGSACAANCVLHLTDLYTEPSNIGTIAFLPHGGSQAPDLTGGGNTTDGGIEQTVNLTVGTTYILSFWLGNMDDAAIGYTSPSTIVVFLNNSSLGSFTNANSTPTQTNWQQFSLSFTALTGANTLRFTQATPSNDSMAGLDDVFLDVARTDVPEPATFAIAGAVLAFLGAVKRRRYEAA